MLIFSFWIKYTKNHAIPHQNPMGLRVQIPYPRARGILKSNGGGDPIPLALRNRSGAQTPNEILKILLNKNLNVYFLF